jgi:hypothetical protein
MAFLDNSGDIILDAVLTDTGRMRLARGDGSFKITKFALGDDEINYALYNKNHASGSAYYDLEILQTPVLEAFTNNTSMMKSKLISIARTNLLYLPVILRNQVKGIPNNATTKVINIFVDQATVEDANGPKSATEFINGYRLTDTSRPIVMDQGIESNAIGDGTTTQLDADLVETQFILEIDNRLGKIADKDGVLATPSFVDDDNIASYYLTTNSNGNYFVAKYTQMSGDVISGPRGYRLAFLIAPSSDLASSTYLFKTIGGTSTLGSAAVRHIDTSVRITGGTTGYRVEVPIRFIKYPQ